MASPPPSRKASGRKDPHSYSLTRHTVGEGGRQQGETGGQEGRKHLCKERGVSRTKSDGEASSEH